MLIWKSEKSDSVCLIWLPVVVVSLISPTGLAFLVGSGLQRHHCLLLNVSQGPVRQTHELPADEFVLFYYKTILHLAPNDDEDKEQKEEDGCSKDDTDDQPATAYGRKSLEWTQKFRRLFPYETVRRSVMDLGLRSKAEWDEYVSDGKPQHGPYLPNHPDEMYAEEWESWDEFLGLIRPYDETRNMVQNVLRLRDMVEYEQFVDCHRQRAEGLRIPAQPRKFYWNKGWRSDEHFFGHTKK